MFFMNTSGKYDRSFLSCFNLQNNFSYVQQLTYQQGETATSYDSINSLTTPNNYYTLLYPDLVHELFNFALYNSNSSKNNASFLRNIGENNTKSSSVDSLLSPRDILFFLQIVSLYQLELSKGNTSITYPSLKLAKLLGVDAYDDENISSLKESNMRSTILKMTSKLESIGLLKVFRRKRKNGMDLTNKLIPVLPDRLHAQIKNSSTNLKISDSSKLEHESNLEHILRTKLFVPIELDFMKSLFKNNLPSKYKLFFLNCIMSAYRNFRQNSSGSDILSFSTTSLELMNKNNISRSTLDRIFRYVKQQGNSFFLQVEHKYTKSDDIDSNRYDKSIFVISINPLVFHISQKWQSQTEEISNFDCDELQDNDLPIFLDTYKEFRTAWSKKQPSIIKKTALNNKDIIIKISNKDIDANIDKNLDEKKEALDKLVKNNQIKPSTLLQTSNSQHLESEQSSLSSKSLKNSVKDFIDALATLPNTNKEDASRTIKDISEKKDKTNTTRDVVTVIPKKKTSHTKSNKDRQHRDFRHFYPISEKDSCMLNFKANREFDINFTNQLLLKLYIKYPEKRFKNKFTFWDYMIKTLKQEKNQGPRVNNPSFRFRCNISTNEHNILESERYLTEIENSFDTNKEMQVRKKIVGLFDNIKAYEILLNSDFSYVDNVCKLTFRKKVEVTMLQQETIKNIIESVYGNKVNIQITTVTNNKFHQKLAKTTEGVIDESKSLSLNLSSTVWHQIRKALREELGDHIDQAWFAKAEATKCKETKTLTLKMPTRFMSDFIKSRYGYAISRISGSFGFKYIEYHH